MKICFLGHTLNDTVGGSVSYTEAIAGALARAGNSVTIVGKMSPARDVKSTIGSHIKYAHICVSGKYAFFSWYIIFSLKVIWFFIRSGGFDVIHGIASRSLFAYLVHAIGWLTRTPIVYSVLSPADRVIRFPGIKHRIICVSKNVKNNQAGSGRVIPPGIDLKKFSAARADPLRKTGRVVVGTMGVATSYRNTSCFIKAIPIILREFPNVYFAAAIKPVCGDDTPLLAKSYADIRNFIIKKGLESRVRIFGKVDAPRFLNSIDIFVYPMRTTRGSIDPPIALIEALASGCCTVSSEIDGIPELIKDMENGLLVKDNETDKPMAYAREVVKLLQDETLSRNISSRGVKSVEGYDVEKITPEILKVYEEVRRQKR